MPKATHPEIMKLIDKLYSQPHAILDIEDQIINQYNDFAQAVLDYAEAGIATGSIKENIIVEENARYQSIIKIATSAYKKKTRMRRREVERAWTETTGPTKKYMWKGTGKLTCPGCRERHGQVRTREEWTKEGSPNEGLTVCGENCKCQLISLKQAEKIYKTEPGNDRALTRRARDGIYRASRLINTVNAGKKEKYSTSTIDKKKGNWDADTIRLNTN